MGHPGAGKDTVCAILRTLRPTVVRLAFADKAYEEVAASFGMTVEEFRALPKDEPSPRLMLDLNLNSDYRDLLMSLSTRSMDEILKKPRSQRFHLRKWATEYRRNMFGSNYWVARLMETYYEAVANDPPGAGRIYAVTDLRHDLELEALKPEGFEVWRVENDRAPPKADHSSELEWPLFPSDRTIRNSGTLEELRSTLVAILNEYECVPA